VTEEDKAAAQVHSATIYELCRDTAMALQELRHGIANVLLDTLEKMPLDINTLVRASCASSWMGMRKA
jgi:hypothetical protein